MVLSTYIGAPPTIGFSPAMSEEAKAAAAIEAAVAKAVSAAARRMSVIDRCC